MNLSRNQRSKPFATFIWMMASAITTVNAADIAPLLRDREAIERVYHEHRIGAKANFEQAMPATLVEKQVHEQLKSEGLLERVYGVRITPAMVSAEVQRINTTTRAPDILAEIKTALGNDEVRFATSFARPLVVDRLLRQKFDGDDHLHTPQRHLAESLRAQLLAVKKDNPIARLEKLKTFKDGEIIEEFTWELTPRPARDTHSTRRQPSGPTQGKASSAVYSIEATVQVAQPLSSPESGHGNGEHKIYFEDLPNDLQSLLNAQLLQPGDVSAVIESVRAFMVYVLRERTSSTLTVSALTLQKRGYEQWLKDQT